MAFNHEGSSLRDRFHYLFATFMSPGKHDKIEVGRIDKGGFEDEDTAENIGCSLCSGAVPSGGSAGVPV